MIDENDDLSIIIIIITIIIYFYFIFIIIIRIAKPSYIDQVVLAVWDERVYA